MARRSKGVTYGKSGGFGNIAAEAKAVVIKAARVGVVRVLNELSEEGPGWSGEFRDSWYVKSRIGAAAQTGGKEGVYSLFNIPGLKPARGPGGRFQKATFSGNQVTFSIGNSAPHAEEAMDLIPGVFFYPGFEPLKPATRGLRYGDLRGEVDPGSGDNRTTAPLDWFTTYMNAGQFQADLQRGVRLGFKSAPRG